MKKNLKVVPGMLPAPLILVSCQDKKGRRNIMSAAWTGMVNSQPAMVSVAITKDRFSHKIITKTKEFVINVPSSEQVFLADFCGSFSGKKINKFQKMGLNFINGKKVKAPLIKQCPMNLECKVRQIVSLKSHDVFFGEIVCFWVKKNYLLKNNCINYKKLSPLIYFSLTNEYWQLGKKIAKRGISLEKTKL